MRQSSLPATMALMVLLAALTGCTVKGAKLQTHPYVSITQLDGAEAPCEAEKKRLRKTLFQAQADLARAQEELERLEAANARTVCESPMRDEDLCYCCYHGYGSMRVCEICYVSP